MFRLLLVAKGFCIGLLDIALKSVVEAEMSEGEEYKIIKEKVCIRKVHNKGMCFNLGEKYPEVVKGIALSVTGVVTLCWIGSLFSKTKKIQQVGLTLLTGGAWSNAVDRFMRGYVVDYIGFQTKTEKTTKITYNLGDFFIAMGAGILMISSMFTAKKKTPESVS